MRAVLRLLCPVCKVGRIFPRLLKMADVCPHCGVRIAREAGYFLGSIYFNYGITCVLCGAVYFGTQALFGASPRVALWITLACAALFPLWFWRYARALWLRFDQSFDPRRPPGADPEPPSSERSS